MNNKYINISKNMQQDNTANILIIHSNGQTELHQMLPMAAITCLETWTDIGYEVIPERKVNEEIGKAQARYQTYLDAIA